MKLNKLIGINVLAGALSFVNFPNLLNGDNPIPEYEFYRVPDSKYTLVHIGQIHRNARGEDTFLRKREVINVQREIYDILEKLIEKNGTNVYQEGLVHNHEDEYLKKLDEARKNSTPQSLKQNMDETIFGHGAPTFLALEGRVALRPTENFDYYHVAKLHVLSPLRVGYFSEKDGKIKLLDNASEVVYNRREDYILDLISRCYGSETNKNHLLVYGEGHDFRDNIERWNSSNPNKKFSLVKITPALVVKKNKSRSDKK